MKICDAINKTVEMVDKMSEDAEEKDLNYIIPIIESLKMVKSNNLLKCISGVLNIINKYRKL